MPIIGVTTLNDVTSVDYENLFGIPSPPPPPASAPPLIGGAPTVSATPNPGQGVSLTASGVLPPSAAATGLRMLSADPQSPLVGEFWYRTDVDQLCVQVAGAVKRVTLT